MVYSTLQFFYREETFSSNKRFSREEEKKIKTLSSKELEMGKKFEKMSEDTYEKRDQLLLLSDVSEHLSEPFFASLYQKIKKEKGVEEEVAFLSLLAIGQGKILFKSEASLSILPKMVRVENFFSPIGGILGYQKKVFELLSKKEFERKGEIIPPPMKEGERREEILAGLLALPQMGEIYPLGGLGDRLNFKTKSGKPLPAALLPFLGRSLLEGLIRDLQAREYLYYKLFGCQLTTPIALMTSFARKNDKYLHLLLMRKGWFSRPKSSVKLFSQELVPVVTEEGKWSLNDIDEPNFQPGGHGALWRMAQNRGIFDWFFQQKREALLIRQINNPIGGRDDTLLKLIGVGRKEKKAFGFVACPRIPDAAEGALALLKSEAGQFAITNIEYTEIKRYGIEKDERFPANTNLLYADLNQILPILHRQPFPEPLLNMKSNVPFIDEKGEKKERKGGRLESMMQNLSDFLTAESAKNLSSFILFSSREKCLAAAKQAYRPGASLLETPEGAAFELLKENNRLLASCGMKLAPFTSPECYLKEGPSTVFHYHPALGPLYSLIRAKIRGGQLADKGELVLEIAELLMENCKIDGSVLIVADSPLGHKEEGVLHYSERTGKAILRNCSFSNLGIDRGASSLHWKNKIKRKESFYLRLKGMSEFFAEGIDFAGSHSITVPDGMRVIAYKKSDGSVAFYKEKIVTPTHFWKYELEGDEIKVSFGSSERITAWLDKRSNTKAISNF